MVDFRLGWVGYRDKDLGSGLLNEAETGNQEVGISLVVPDVGLGRSVGGEAKRRTHDVRHSLCFGFPNGFGGVLAAVAFVKKFMRQLMDKYGEGFRTCHTLFEHDFATVRQAIGSACGSTELERNAGIGDVLRSEERR